MFIPLLIFAPVVSYSTGLPDQDQLPLMLSFLLWKIGYKDFKNIGQKSYMLWGRSLPVIIEECIGTFNPIDPKTKSCFSWNVMICQIATWMKWRTLSCAWLLKLWRFPSCYSLRNIFMCPGRKTNFVLDWIGATSRRHKRLSFVSAALQDAYLQAKSCPEDALETSKRLVRRYIQPGGTATRAWVGKAMSPVDQIQNAEVIIHFLIFKWKKIHRSRSLHAEIASWKFQTRDLDVSRDPRGLQSL